MRAFLFSILICFYPVVNAETLTIVGEHFPRATEADGTGVQFEMVKALFEPLGYQLRFQVYPYKRAVQMIENEQADIIVGIYQSSAQLLYSAKPEDADKMVAIFTQDKANLFQGKQSLAGKRIEATPGFERYIRRTLAGIDFEFAEVSTRKQALKKLVHNRSDYMIDTEAVFMMDEINHYKARLSYQAIGFFEIYAGFANTVKGRKLKQLWDNRYPALINSAQAEQLYLKWELAREYQIIKSFYQ